MTSLEIQFNENGAVLNLGGIVTGIMGELQTMLVVAGTDRGTDAVFPDKGTSLLSEAVRGGIVDITSARHSANIAALLTHTFYSLFTAATTEDTIAELSFTTADYDGRKLILHAQAVTIGGVEIGQTNTVTI